MRNNAYIPSVGYGMWKDCSHFTISDEFRDDEDLLRRYNRHWKIDIDEYNDFKKCRTEELLYDGMKMKKQDKPIDLNLPIDLELEEEHDRINELYADQDLIPKKLYSEMLNLVKNMIIIALEKNIELDDIYKISDIVNDDIAYCNRFIRHQLIKHTNYPPFLNWYGFIPANLSFYSFIFFNKLKELFEDDFQTIFTLSEKDRDIKMQKFIKERVDLEYGIFNLTSEEMNRCEWVEIDEDISNNKDFKVYLHRSYDKNNRCFRFGLELVHEPYEKWNFGFGGSRLQGLELYSEIKKGPLIAKFLECYPFDLEYAEYDSDKQNQ